MQELVGKTIKSIVRESYSNVVCITMTDGTIFNIAYQKGCCDVLQGIDILGTDVEELIGGVVRLIDFDVEKDFEEEDEEDCTASSYFLGTSKGVLCVRFKIRPGCCGDGNDLPELELHKFETLGEKDED